MVHGCFLAVTLAAYLSYLVYVPAAVFFYERNTQLFSTEADDAPTGRTKIAEKGLTRKSKRGRLGHPYMFLFSIDKHLV